MTENDTQHNPLDELLEAVGRDQVTWQPETPGDQVAGVVLELDEMTTEYGTAPVVVVLEPDGREVRIMGFGAVLQRHIYTSSIEPGDLFACRFIGKVQGRTGRPYADYKVVVRDRDGNPKSKDQAAARPQPVDHVLDELVPEEPF